jgi:hypothetical protein
VSCHSSTRQSYSTDSFNLHLHIHTLTSSTLLPLRHSSTSNNHYCRLQSRSTSRSFARSTQTHFNTPSHSLSYTISLSLRIIHARFGNSTSSTQQTNILCDAQEYHKHSSVRARHWLRQVTGLLPSVLPLPSLTRARRQLVIRHQYIDRRTTTNQIEGRT